MTSETTDNHILDEIPVYLAGGLTAAEREQFDAHVQSCPDCSAALVDARTMDDAMGALFKNSAPSGDFEDRLIARFRLKTTATTLHPMVRRAAIGVAASLLLGAAGFVASQNMERLERVRCASNLRQMGQAMGMYGDIERNDRSPQEKNPTYSLALKTQDLAPDVFTTPSSRFSRANQGQNALYGDGHLEYQGTTWAGSYRRGPSGSSGDTVSAYANPYPSHRPLSGSFAFPAGTGGDRVAPTDHFDSVLLPSSDGDEATKDQGAVNRPVDASRLKLGPLGTKSYNQQLTDSEQNKSLGIATHALAPANASVTLNGANGYVGGTVITSGKLDLSGGSSGAGTRAGVGGGSGGAYFGVNAAPPGQTAANYRSEDQRQAELAPALTSPPTAVSTATTPAGQNQQAVLEDTAKKSADIKDEESPSPTLQPAPAPNENSVETRKIIREGTMAFEVDSFDSTVMTISKIVAEEGGFVATTDSDKLANGKVSGTVVVRVPPEHLDTVVLKLRGIGDLKSQKITAQDITKQYTDLESELRAAQAMQERLLDIIKNAKGAVKDLLEAEKQLGVWREKIEQVEGEIRYDNNLISLSTLSVSLMERDIKSAAFSSINEQITMALETEKVEEAYNAAKDAIANAKGRIVQSELKQYEAGQFGATIRAQLPPDAADAVIGRLRQLDGRLANFQRQRSQVNEEGTVAPLDASKVKREDVTLNFTIYNLANIEPRRTTSLMLAASNVEDAYSAILEQATAAGARVVTSNINRPQPNQSTGSIQLQVPSDKADALLLALRGSSELISQESTENPDTQNVTNAKRGIVVQIISLAAMTPRRSTNLTVAAPDVDAAYRLVLDKVAAAGGRIVGSGVNRGNPEQTNASVNFQVPTDKADALLAEVRGAGELMRQDTTEDPNAQNTTDAKRGYQLQIVALAGVPARQSEQLQVAASDVPAAFNAIIDALHGGDARIIASQLNQQDPANISGAISFEMTRPARPAIDAAIDKAGEVISRNLTRSQDTDNTVDNKVRVDLTMGSASQLPPRETTTLGVEVSDVQKAVDDLLSSVNDAGGREIDKDISQDQKGRTTAHVIVEVPLDKSDSLSDQIGQMGHQRVKEVSRNPQAPQGRIARGRFEVTFADASTALGGEESAWDAIRHGLAVSAMGLRWSVQMIVVGLCFVVPWVLALGLFVWGGRRFLRRGKNPAAPRGMGVPPM